MQRRWAHSRSITITWALARIHFSMLCNATDWTGEQWTLSHFPQHTRTPTMHVCVCKLPRAPLLLAKASFSSVMLSRANWGLSFALKLRLTDVTLSILFTWGRMQVVRMLTDTASMTLYYIVWSVVVKDCRNNKYSKTWIAWLSGYTVLKFPKWITWGNILKFVQFFIYIHLEEELKYNLMNNEYSMESSKNAFPKWFYLGNEMKKKKLWSPADSLTTVCWSQAYMAIRASNSGDWTYLWYYWLIAVHIYILYKKCESLIMLRTLRHRRRLADRSLPINYILMHRTVNRFSFIEFNNVFSNHTYVVRMYIVYVTRTHTVIGRIRHFSPFSLPPFTSYCTIVSLSFDSKRRYDVDSPMHYFHRNRHHNDYQ